MAEYKVRDVVCDDERIHVVRFVLSGRNEIDDF